MFVSLSIQLVVVAMSQVPLGVPLAEPNQLRKDTSVTVR